ncbi:MAG: transglutaminase domain-containing protein [Eubacterium sp.]|nr:transglutaminase domain-containing protein [Eubacterium sp.]
MTSYNPDYYTNMIINDNMMSIEGKYTDDPISRIYLQAEITANAVIETNQDGAFTAKLKLELAPADNNNRVVIVLTSGTVMSYRIEYDDGWYFPDNGIKQKNTEVFDHIYETGSAAWANYVSDELTEESVRETLEEIQTLSDEITEGIEDDYKKMLALGHWMSDNIYYDRDARDNSVTLSTISMNNVLKDHKTVCSGYANLYCALLEAQGIRAVNIKGSVVSSSAGINYEDLAHSPQNHEWTAVWLDDRWIYMDTVWNSDNFYELERFYTNPSDDQYSDITPFALSLNHRADRAEQRHYFRALEYFEKTQDESQEEFSYDAPMPDEKPDNQADFYIKVILYVVVMAAVAAVALYIIRYIRNKDKKGKLK